MDSLVLAFNVVFPLCVYMLIGGLIKKVKILSENTMKEINNMIFKVLIPISLFFDIYKSDLKETVQPRLFIYTALLVIAAFAVSWILVRRFVKEPADVPTMVQGIYRSNYVLFGTVICANLAGDEGSAMAAAVAVLVVPLFNILAVVMFEVLRGGKVKAGRLIIQIFKNPLVDAGLLGALFNLLRLHIPSIIESPLMTLGDIASPLALVVLGAMLSFKSIISHKGRLAAAVVGRLIIIPAIALTILALLGFRGPAMVALLAAFASPTAVASVPMAQSMGGNGKLAGEIVAISTAFSIVTVFGFIAAMSALGLF